MSRTGDANLRVLHVIPSLSIEDGGPTVALLALVDALNEFNVSITILTTLGPRDQTAQKHQFARKAAVVEFRRNIGPYKIAWRVVPWLRANLRSFDIVHVHAVFSFVSVAAARMARRHQVPYLVRPLGVLNRWGMKNRRPFAKRLSYGLLESKILRNASALHFTSGREAEQAYELDPCLREVPAITLPLPIASPPELEEGHPFLDRFPELLGKRWILFLSRFAHQKGLDLLLDAFTKIAAEHPDCMLVLAGGGDSFYVQTLERRIVERRIEKRVLWTGYLSGVEKADALAMATIFVLPSYSESFGIAAAEALASGCACVLSDGIPFAEDAARAGGAVVTRCEVNELFASLNKLLRDPAERGRLARNARRFAEQQFSPNAIGSALMAKYRELLATGKPAKEQIIAPLG